MIMKWDTLKRKAIEATGMCGFYSFEMLAPYALMMGIEDGTFDWKKNVDKLRDEVIRTIDGWDVRGAKRLIDLFPGCVPAKCRGIIPTCYMADNESMDWMVEFKGV